MYVVHFIKNTNQISSQHQIIKNSRRFMKSKNAQKLMRESFQSRFWFFFHFFINNWEKLAFYKDLFLKDIFGYSVLCGCCWALDYYFQCLLKFCREEEVASESVVRVHFTKGIDFSKWGSRTLITRETEFFRNFWQLRGNFLKCSLEFKIWQESLAYFYDF